MKILKGLDDRLPLDRWTISAPFLNNCLVPLLWVFWSQLEPGCLLPATACWAATPVLYWFVSQEGGGWRGSWIWTIRMLVLLDLRHGVQKHFLPRRTLATSPGRNPQLRKQPVWVLSSPSPLPCLEWAQWPLRHNPGDVAQAMLWINSTCCVWFSVSTAPGEGCCPRNPLPEALVCLTTNPTFLLPDPYHHPPTPRSSSPTPITPLPVFTEHRDDLSQEDSPLSSNSTSAAQLFGCGFCLSLAF